MRAGALRHVPATPGSWAGSHLQFALGRSGSGGSLHCARRQKAVMSTAEPVAIRML